MMNRFGGAWVAVAVALAGGAVVLDRWKDDRGAACGGSGEACPAAALRRARPAIAIAQAEGGPRLLVFSSASCPACARMKPVLAAVERECDAARDITHLDVDADPGERIAASYGVTLLPTVMSVDARGHEVARLTGVQPAEAIERALEEVRGAKCAANEVAPSRKAM